MHLSSVAKTAPSAAMSETPAQMPLLLLPVQALMLTQRAESAAVDWREKERQLQDRQKKACSRLRCSKVRLSLEERNLPQAKAEPQRQCPLWKA